MLQNATRLRKSAPPITSLMNIFFVHACHRFWKCYKTFTFCSLLRRCKIPCACRAKRHLNVQKWSEPLVCFVHFDFDMCFAPQRRALFRHLNFQKSGPRMVCIVHVDFEMCFAPQGRRAIFHLSSGQMAPHPPL